ncbi:phosphoserine transaminase [Arcanobacterium haemolyticum]|nr:phosphoserine transaminase [Arcanobacterium haemolyticum]
MTLHLPNSLRPSNGRFGSGPSKVRPEQLVGFVEANSPMGQSHRQSSVRSVVGRIRSGLTDLFSLPDGYEVLLGNGGASLLWDAIAFCVVESRAQAAVFGEFSSKAAQASTRVPWIDNVEIRRADVGSLALCESRSDIDTYLYPHNETSTGVISPVRRYGAESFNGDEPLTIVDATSCAGGVPVDITRTDLYYFSPQKCFGSDGGLWLAIASPRAIARIERLCTDRWIPDILNLRLALTNSRKDQTLNTPAIATLLMVANQVEWMLDQGGLAAMSARCTASSSAIYSWATRRPDATPFVVNPQWRSPVVATIDFDDDIRASEISSFLRGEGIVDIDPYRSLGRNQFRFGTFPNVDLADVESLLACIDWAIDHGIGRD